MKSRTVAAILFSLAATCAAQDRPQASQTVVVYISNTAPIPNNLLFRAETTAAEIMATANVHVEFRMGKPKSDLPFTYTASLRTSTDEYLKPGALAYAQPYGTRIVVFYDRIRAIPRAETHVILGHVLAHEITHMLRGDTEHATTGLMKATWTSDDYFAMLCGHLALSADDIDEIHTGMALIQAKSLLAAAERR
jgi:Zn-dependent protease with chaperone function